MGTGIKAGAVVSQVWAIYRNQFGVLVGTAIVLFALQFLIALVLSGSLIFVVVVLFWVLNTLYQGAVVELVSDVKDGRRDYTVMQLLRSVEPVLWPLMIVSVLFGIGVAIGFVLIIVPGLFLLTIWSVVAPVTVLERPGVLAAFGRSRELVRGNGWSVFGVIILIYLAVVVISVLAGAIGGGFGAGGRAIVQFAVTVLLAPVPALGASVLYFALRGEPVAPTSAQSPPTAA
ncbi:MAG: hypothetical protein ABI323_11685 [Solirubrobacteraceae bacterium]